jgi:hypothetical protein
MLNHSFSVNYYYNRQREVAHAPVNDFGLVIFFVLYCRVSRALLRFEVRAIACAMKLLRYF